MKSYTLITFLISFSLFVTGCENNTSRSDESPQSQNEGVRPAAQGMMSAAYFTLITDHADSDTLIAAESPVAGDTQIHESYINDEGLSSMQEVRAIPLTKGDSLKFERGGLHIMLMDLKQDLNSGDTVRIDLIYSSGSKHTTVLTVFDSK